MAIQMHHLVHGTQMLRFMHGTAVKNSAEFLVHSMRNAAESKFCSLRNILFLHYTTAHNVKQVSFTEAVFPIFYSEKF